ncbi:MAG: hypothetical protein ABH950_07115 [Candidatus Altiarchaeota archaeon]
MMDIVIIVNRMPLHLVGGTEIQTLEITKRLWKGNNRFTGWGNPDFISEENGILVEPKNVAQLRDAILQLVGDEKMRTEFGKNSLHVRETKVLDWVSHAKKIYSIYLKLTDHEHTNTR